MLEASQGLREERGLAWPNNLEASGREDDFRSVAWRRRLGGVESSRVASPKEEASGRF